MSNKPVAQRKPLLSRVPPEFVRAVLKGHSALGLAFAAALYVVCLSGTVAVFAREYQRWENASGRQMTSASPDMVQNALAAAVARAGTGLEHVYVTLPRSDLPRLQVQTDADVERNWTIDAKGNLSPSATPWTDFITRLHIYLHLPRTWGMFLVGLIGVALLSSLISGLLAHPRIFRDAFHLRLGGSKRLQEADLHNRLGVWALPFHITVSLSGAVLGLTTLIVGVLGLAVFQGDANKVYALFLPAEPVDNPAPASLLDLRPMFAQLPRDGRVEYVMLEHPTEQGGGALFNVRRDEKALAGVDAYAFDRTGKLYYSKQASENTTGESVLGSLGPLHFGWFGGGIIKIAYGLLGLGLTYLAASGVTIWLARRRDKGRPAPGWERIWSAVVWSQPVAYVCAAGAAAVFNDIMVGALIGVWGAITFAFLLAAIRVPVASLSLWGRRMTGAALVMLGLFHAVVIAPGSEDNIVWLIDAVLIALGALLLAASSSAVRARFASNVTR